VPIHQAEIRIGHDDLVSEGLDVLGDPLSLAELSLEPTIYLVSECSDAEEERAALQTVFGTIFENQLDGWWRDRATWPTSRSFGTFSRWFDCQFHSILLDLADEPLIEEPF
jgi:hypothetical protein